MASAFVLISCELGSERAIIDELKTFEPVKEAIGTFGAYDILTKVESPDAHKLSNTITQYIRKIDKVRTTLTLTVIEEQESIQL